jgi:hypothetical protein
VKFLTIIFAFYVLILPCIPCADKDECNDSTKTEITNATNDHKDHQHENKNCNPFCSCACCGHIFFPNFRLEKITVTKHLENLKQQFFYTNISLSSNFFGNIWQPPKLS